MAKTPAPPPPPAPPAPAFVFDDALPIPAARTGGGGGGEKSDLALKLEAVPVDKSFIVPITVDASITGDEARLADFKKQAKTLSNRIGGAIRRLRDANEGALKKRNFAVRTVSDDKLGFGIRIWRTADTK